MATQYAFGKIVTSGLVLSLNAADRNSYPGSGTVWNDMSGNGNNGTLTNGPTFNSANGGSFVFDGVDDYVNCGSNSSLNLNQNYSILFWIRTNSSMSGTIIQRYLNDVPYPGYAININRLTSIGKIDLYTGGAWTTGLGSNINDGIWHFVGVSINSTTCNFYLDNSVISFLVGASTSNPTDTLFIGSTEGPVVSFSGSMSSIQIYNRALSASEVAQNYNAQKSRFNL